MDVHSIQRRIIGDIVFAALRTGYVTAVVSCVLTYLCALSAYTPLKGWPGTRLYQDVGPKMCGLLFCLFFFGAFWVEFSERAYASRPIRYCIYLAFAVSPACVFIF
jgi:hypothetical protein